MRCFAQVGDALRKIDGHNRIVTASMVPQIAKEFGLRVVDVTSTFNDGLQPDYVAARASASCHFYCNRTETDACVALGTTPGALRTGACTCDHTHLSDDGYRVLAEEVSKTVSAEWAQLSDGARRVRRHQGEHELRSLQAGSDVL